MRDLRDKLVAWRLAIVIVVLIVAILIGFYLLINSYQVSKQNNSSSSIQTQTGMAAFNFSINDTYPHAKKELALSGWVVEIPDSYIKEAGTQSASKTPIDVQYPEIDSCGSGKDAICTVNFTKGSFNNHLNLKSTFRNGNTVWLVVGNE